MGVMCNKGTCHVGCGEAYLTRYSAQSRTSVPSAGGEGRGGEGLRGKGGGEEGLHSQGWTHRLLDSSHGPDTDTCITRQVLTHNHMHKRLYTAHSGVHTRDLTAAAGALCLGAPQLFLTHNWPTGASLVPHLLLQKFCIPRSPETEAPALEAPALHRCQPSPLGHKGQSQPCPLRAMWWAPEKSGQGWGQKPGSGSGSHALSLLLPRVTEEEAEAQRGQVACPRMHSQYMS